MGLLERAGKGSVSVKSFDMLREWIPIYTSFSILSHDSGGTATCIAVSFHFAQELNMYNHNQEAPKLLSVQTFLLSRYSYPHLTSSVVIVAKKAIRIHHLGNRPVFHQPIEIEQMVQCCCVSRITNNQGFAVGFC